MIRIVLLEGETEQVLGGDRQGDQQAGEEDAGLASPDEQFDQTDRQQAGSQHDREEEAVKIVADQERQPGRPGGQTPGQYANDPQQDGLECPAVVIGILGREIGIELETGDQHQSDDPHDRAHQESGFTGRLAEEVESLVPGVQDGGDVGLRGFGCQSAQDLKWGTREEGETVHAVGLVLTGAVVEQQIGSIDHPQDKIRPPAAKPLFEACEPGQLLPQEKDDDQADRFIHGEVLGGKDSHRHQGERKEERQEAAGGVVDRPRCQPDGEEVGDKRQPFLVGVGERHPLLAEAGEDQEEERDGESLVAAVRPDLAEHPPAGVPAGETDDESEDLPEQGMAVEEGGGEEEDRSEEGAVAGEGADELRRTIEMGEKGERPVVPVEAQARKDQPVAQQGDEREQDGHGAVGEVAGEFIHFLWTPIAGRC